MVGLFIPVLFIHTTAILSQAAFVNIDGGGITGTLEISSSHRLATGEVSFRFHSLQSFYGSDYLNGVTLHIRSLPPSYHSDCSEADLGTVYDPTRSFNDSNYASNCQTNKTSCALGDMRSRLGVLGEWTDEVETTFPNNRSHLNGRDSIVGRSLVLYDGRGSPITCSVISNRSRLANRSRQNSREAKLPGPVAGVIRLTQLVDDGQAAYDTQILVDLFTNGREDNNDTVSLHLVQDQMNSSTDCQTISDRMLNSTTCRGHHTRNCYSLDLSSTHGTITVGNGHRRVFFTDSELKLDMLDDTMVLVVRNLDGRQVSCSNLTPRSSVVATFDGDVTGTIKCVPDEVGSRLMVNLSGLARQAGKYHVHLFPVENGDCGTTGGHYNPFEINQTLPSGQGSSDRYEVGDLSGLFGLLTGKESVQFTYIAPNIQCDGIHGILGRSIVIHRTDGKRWQCATIEPLGLYGNEVTKLSAVARFQGRYSGYIKLTQYTIAPGVQTSTIVDLRVQQNGSMTGGHKWHVHQYLVAGFTGQKYGAANCAARYAGGHYNPYSVDLTDGYATGCSPNNQLRCELGDLSGKHRKCSIYPIGSRQGRQLTHDLMLPLSGPNNVMLRSIVIHAADSGAPRIACASLYPEGVKQLAITFRKPDILKTDEIRQSIAKVLALPVSEVLYFSVKTDETETCASATFTVKSRETIANWSGGSDFESSLTFGDSRFGRFLVDSECLRRPHSEDGEYHSLATVELNGGGAMGEIEIDESQDGKLVSFRIASFRLPNGLKLGDVEAAIHEYPPRYRSDCTESDVGPVYDPSAAFSATNYSTDCVSDQTVCALGDLKRRLGTKWSTGRRMTTSFRNDSSMIRSVIGRSFVLYNSHTGKPLACAPIKRHHPDNGERLQEINLQVKLKAPVAGHVTFTQPIDQLSGELYPTQILVEVFSNSKVSQNNTLGDYAWHLSKGKVNSGTDCIALSERVRHVRCDVNNVDQCHFTDLVGKHGSLTVPRGRASRVLFIDDNLPLQNVTGLVLVITDSTGDSVSCGKIHPLTGVVAQFTGTVKGEVSCIPTYEGSLITVSLNGLQAKAGGYHIHTYPVHNGDCLSTGGHYNPYNVGKSHSPTTGLGSYDQYEVGDLSGLFGSLKEKSAVSFTRFDANVRCDDILGRSVVIHRGDKSRWQCATFEPLKPDGFTLRRHSAQATFTGKTEGYIRLTQWEMESQHLSFFTTTIVDMDVRANGTMTLGHKFHVHEHPTAGFDGSEVDNCRSNFTRGHFNPLSVDLQTGYSTECNQQNQLRCEAGDLSSKHGLYTLHPLNDAHGRRLTSDAYLPLAGPNSVVFRSIVLHAANSGSPRMACATLYPEGYRQFSVVFVKPDEIDTSDLREALAHRLGIGYGDVMYLDVDVTGKCVSVTFVVDDETVTQLHDSGFHTNLKTTDRIFGGYTVASSGSCLSNEPPTKSSAPMGNAVINPVSLLCFFLALAGMINLGYW